MPAIATEVAVSNLLWLLFAARSLRYRWTRRSDRPCRDHLWMRRVRLCRMVSLDLDWDLACVVAMMALQVRDFVECWWKMFGVLNFTIFSNLSKTLTFQGCNLPLLTIPNYHLGYRSKLCNHSSSDTCLARSLDVSESFHDLAYVYDRLLSAWKPEKRQS